MKRSALPLLASAVLLAGCGGGDDDATTEARTPSTTAAPATTTAAPTTTTAPTTTPDAGPTAPSTPAGDREIAEAGLLKLADLPGNWKEGNDGGVDKVDGPCPAIVAAKRATSARAKANSFESGDQKISSNVYLYETAAQAQRSLEAVSGVVSRGCITKVTLEPVRAAAKKAGATISDVRTSSPALTGGDETRTFRFTVVITAKGRTDTVTLAVGSSRVGRGLALTATVGLNDQAQQQVTASAVKRLTDAQAVGP